MPLYTRSKKSNANKRIESAANQIKAEAEALGHVKGAASSIALEAHGKGGRIAWSSSPCWGQGSQVA
jgi:hypothetical protein